MKPLKDKLYCQVIPEPEFENGIIVGESSLKKHKAKVLAIGPKVEHIKVGDIIKYNPNAVYGNEWEEDGKTYVFVREEQDLIYRD